jgi:hypothetical protein
MFKITLLAAVTALWTTVAFAGCGTGECAVAAFGQGGIASDGKAQGAHLERPSTLYSGSTYFNTGNEDAGRIEVTGQGAIQGTVREDITRGHASGIFGDASGQF